MSEVSSEDVQKLLAPQRTKLDAIERILLDTLRERARVIEEVADIKHRHGIAVMQHGRVTQIHERVRAYAEANNLSAEYLIALFDMIIAESCRIEELVMDRRGKSK